MEPWLDVQQLQEYKLWGLGEETSHEELSSVPEDKREELNLNMTVLFKVYVLMA